MDMTASIAPRSDQLNADDALTQDLTVTVVEVRQGTDEQPFEFHSAEYPGRPYKPSKSMRRVIARAWGTDPEAAVGRRMLLHRDPDITFGRERVGGLIIAAMSDIEAAFSIPLTVTRGKKRHHDVAVLTAPAAAPAPTPDDIAACDDQDLLRRWWIALPDRPDLRDLIQARVTEVRADTTRAATIAAEATAGARDTLPVEGGAS